MEGDARQLVKEGTVTATYPERHTARVVFPDKDDMVGAEMPILTSCSAGNKSYSMPDVGDMVVCLFASNSDMTGNGWIIGSRFNDKSKPNANSQDVTRIDFADGTFVEYNRKTHELKLTCEGKITIDAKDEIKIKSADKITLEATDEIKFAGKADIKFDASGGLNLRSVGDAVINAQTIHLNHG